MPSRSEQLFDVRPLLRSANLEVAALQDCGGSCHHIRAVQQRICSGFRVAGNSYLIHSGQRVHDDGVLGQDLHQLLVDGVPAPGLLVLLGAILRWS